MPSLCSFTFMRRCLEDDDLLLDAVGKKRKVHDRGKEGKTHLKKSLRYFFHCSWLLSCRLVVVGTQLHTERIFYYHCICSPWVCVYGRQFDCILLLQLTVNGWLYAINSYMAGYLQSASTSDGFLELSSHLNQLERAGLGWDWVDQGPCYGSIKEITTI